MTTRRKAGRIADELAQVYRKHQAELPEYGWASEGDRWAELVFCLVCRIRLDDLEATRACVDVLNMLGLLEPRVLATLDPDDAAMLNRVLQSHGFSVAEARKTIKVLQAVGLQTGKLFNGKIQRLLRNHGEKLRSEIARAFAGSGLSSRDLNHAATLWLQNALSVPLSLESDAVKAFCKSNGASLPELVDAADELNINMALIDDLLALEQLQQIS
jgi:hypothetical protein